MYFNLSYSFMAFYGFSLFHLQWKIWNIHKNKVNRFWFIYHPASKKKKKPSLWVWGDGPLVESLPCKPEDLSLDPRMDAKSRHGDTCLWSLCLSILHIKRLLFVLMSLIEFYSKTHFFVGKSNAHTSFHYWILVQ